MSAQTVLLVDSHDDSRTIYRIILEHHGYVVLGTCCPEEAVRVARARRPDLIVLELAPFRASALEGLRALKSHPATASIPVLALSTALGDPDRERALAAGCAGYLLKPCPPLELLAEARRLLASAA